MPEQIKWVLVGMVLMFVLLIVAFGVAERIEKRRNGKGWCERRSRAVYRPLPEPDLTEDQAKRYLDHVRFADYDWPGRRNEAICRYLTGKHDAETMERFLDERFGFGGRGGYRRGELIAAHEEQMRRDAERRQGSRGA